MQMITRRPRFHEMEEIDDIHNLSSTRFNMLLLVTVWRKAIGDRRAIYSGGPT